ncbi:hypothetical protein LCGC14_2249020 [marine sediment metagenome]|uniref:Uncharacterized protein n=1 Tax=marine sediment metagenome TaxID=412755 RepID=A0A0F9FY38_9ZZZZ
MQKVRGDALPESIRLSTPCHHYNECGCEVSSCCMDCPLPVCKLEFSQGMRTVRFTQRNLRIAHLRDEGRTVEWIAQVFGISERAIFAALSKVKKSEASSLTDRVRSDKIDVAAIAVSENGESHHGR